MNKKNYIILFFILFYSFNKIRGQEFPLYTQYMYNKGSINPGFIGVDGKISIGLMHRQQWLGVTGAPTTTALSFQLPFEKTAFGIEILKDDAGPVSKIMGKLQFSYNLELDYFTFLSLGVDAGIYNHKFDINKLLIKDEDEEIFSQNYNSIDFDVGVGAFLYAENWYLGISSPNLNLTKYYKNFNSEIDKRRLIAYIIGGYNFEISQRSIFQPSFIIRYVDGMPLTPELSLNLKWNETLTTGLAYRYNSAYSLLVGINITRKLHMGYSFDWDQSPFYKTNYGSHEAFVRYYLSTEENSARFQSPRFF